MKGPSYRNLINLEIFREGDYSEVDKGVWGKNEFEEVKQNLLDYKAPIIYNRNDSHDQHSSNTLTIGYIESIERRERDGVWLANGKLIEDFAKLVENGHLNQKSISLGTIKRGKKKVMLHVALLGKELPEIPGLKENYLALFNGEVKSNNSDFSKKENIEDDIEINFTNKKIKRQEDNKMSNSMNDPLQGIDTPKTFAASDVKLLILEELKRQEATFSTEKESMNEKFDNQVKKFKKDISEREEKISKLEDNIKISEAAIEEHNESFALLQKEKDQISKEFSALQKKVVEIMAKDDVKELNLPGTQADALEKILINVFSSGGGQQAYDLMLSQWKENKDAMEVTFGAAKLPGGNETVPYATINTQRGGASYDPVSRSRFQNNGHLG